MLEESNKFDYELNADGKIIDFLTGKLLVATPEERVRQRYLRILHFEYRYPIEVMRSEVSVWSGSSEVKDKQGRPIRADIVVYLDEEACSTKDQGRILLVVECKAPNEKSGYGQLVSYIFNTSAQGGVWFNGEGSDDEVEYFRKFSEPKTELKKWIGIPRYGESWDSLGRRTKSDLVQPKDIKGLLRRCHNRLHGRGNDGEEEDLTMDMVRVLLAKAMDEESTEPLPEFYCTSEEFNSSDGVKAVKNRILQLFEKVKRANPDVFSKHETITVGNRAIADVVVELQDYQLLSENGAAHEWDLMGYAYEQYASVYLKREKGQYFTNRLAVDLIVRMIAPDYLDIVLDPAGGSGGFLTGVMRYVRNQIVDSKGSNTAKQRQLDRHRTNLFMVEISKRLVKVAKTAMILNGDGHAGMTAGDSLGEYGDFDKTILARANSGTPSVIVTNPPFAGVGEGRVSHSDVLHRFETGKKWEMLDGQYRAGSELVSEGVPPELLFFERCIDWLAPGGRLGIVMPKSFLDTKTHRPGREILFRECKLLAVINCHKDTFQPHTGVRTCILILEKYSAGSASEKDDYSIFMAVSRKVGQDSEGRPIFKRNPDNTLTEKIDHDLGEIGDAFDAFQEGAVPEKPYIYAVKKSELDQEYKINPQRYLPHLNETLKYVEALDDTDDWSVSTIGTLSSDIRIFKGPRLKSENLIVHEVDEYVEPYYTPSAILQEKSESAKLLDVSRATKKQLATIAAIRVYRGDIVITRSGTIGRIAMVTKRFDNAIVSDDLIRVRIPEENMRNYVFAFLQSLYAQDQLSRNEYGAIQQHLEPEHVRNVLIPLPAEGNDFLAVSESVARLISAKETLEDLNSSTVSELESKIGSKAS